MSLAHLPATCGASTVGGPLDVLLDVVASDHIAVEFSSVPPEIWGPVGPCPVDDCPGLNATVEITWTCAAWASGEGEQVPCCLACAAGVLTGALSEARNGTRVSVTVLDASERGAVAA